MNKFSIICGVALMVLFLAIIISCIMFPIVALMAQITLVLLLIASFALLMFMIGKTIGECIYDKFNRKW